MIWAYLSQNPYSILEKLGRPLTKSMIISIYIRFGCVKAAEFWRGTKLPSCSFEKFGTFEYMILHPWFKVNFITLMGSPKVLKQYVTIYDQDSLPVQLHSYQ